MHPRLRTLGYREVRFEHDSILGKSGQVVRGHEFHYSDLDDASADPETIPVYSAVSRRNDGRKSEGYLVNRTLGSYIHLHFQSLPACARSFADACRKYRKSRRAADEAP
jgi:cobyrinic acid a,c-diamide synthase